MGAAQFTPAPWLRETNLVYALDEDGKVNRFSASVSGGFTHYHSRAHTTLDEQEANARLIAAAPELYEALERLFAVTVSLKFERGDGPPIASDAAYDIAVNAARSALAKVRGEQEAHS